MKSYAADLRALFDIGVRAADPLVCVPPHLPSPPRGKTVVLAAGKAAAAMAHAVELHWPYEMTGLAVTRYGHGVSCERIEVIEARHPVPDGAGAAAAARMIEMMSGLSSDDLVIALVSGGGSALLPLPAPGIELSIKQNINRQLLASGAPITEMNIVRKHLSAIKGGRLAQAAYPAQLLTIGISDVPFDDPSILASGPTVPDCSTLVDARTVLARYAISVPEEVMSHLQNPASETPKPGSKYFDRARVVMAARPSDMIKAVEDAANRMGFQVVNLGAEVEGEARVVGKEHAKIALELKQKKDSGSAPILLLSGGETTVTVTNSAGRGGRNVEYLLSVALALEGHAGFEGLAADTDGIDGTEDNAGAIFHAESLKLCRSAGLDPSEALEMHNAYTAFELTDGLLKTGPTRTNVNDLRMIVID